MGGGSTSFPSALPKYIFITSTGIIQKGREANKMEILGMSILTSPTVYIIRCGDLEGTEEEKERRKPSLENGYHSSVIGNVGDEGNDLCLHQ